MDITIKEICQKPVYAFSWWQTYVLFQVVSKNVPLSAFRY